MKAKASKLSNSGFNSTFALTHHHTLHTLAPNSFLDICSEFDWSVNIVENKFDSIASISVWEIEIGNGKKLEAITSININENLFHKLNKNS